MKIFYITLFILPLVLFANISAQIYVSPNGSDSNPGTFNEPLATIPAAENIAQGGDTIYLRGGIYILSVTITISKNGTEDNRYYMFAYQNERPILDFTSQPFGSSQRGIRLFGNYWYIKGIDIYGAGDNGMFIRGSFNIIEYCAFYENRDTGLQLGNGASYNKIINCDSYFNVDPGQGNADGFAAKLDVGTDNYFFGCRAWQNSDDGWDGYLRGANNINTIVEKSWCFMNGYLKDGTPSSGNGNGYKMGGGDNGNSANLANNFTLIKSIAFDNLEKGFDQNNNRGSMTLYNCTAYRNGTNYSLPGIINQGETATIINSIALGNSGFIANHVIQQTNSWLSPFVVTNDDFVSIDTAAVRGSRRPDGGLPIIDFLHLAEESDFIDGGTDVGLPYVGSAPDLGAFEFGDIVPVELVSFSASVSGNSIILNWITASEINNYGFEIQKKFSDSHFRTIGFVQGAGTSTESNEYSFIHEFTDAAVNIYRLKQVDFSGAFSYSDEVYVSVVPDNFSLKQNYPNPFNPVTTIKFSLKEKATVSLSVYNLIGEIVALLIHELKEPGSYSINFNSAHLSSGIYIVVLKQGEKTLSKKMTLLK